MREPDYVSSLTPYVDEQTKAAGMAAAAATAAAAAKTIAKTPDEILLDTVQSKLAQKKAELAAAYEAQGLNPDGSVTNARGTVTAQPGTALFNSIKAANDRAAADAKLKEDTKPTTPAPEGTYYQWHVFPTGGGEWRLVKSTFGGTTSTSGVTPTITYGVNQPGSPGSSTLTTGSTTTTTTPTGPTLAINTFKNTLALFFGAGEMTKPWVDELYKLVNPYYKSGSSIDEALNMAIQEGRNNPNLKEFTSRFKGIYDLQDKLLQGVAVTVPTIAEFVASEAKMGDVLNQAGLSSLNQQSYLGDIIGKGVNVTEFTNRINNVFLRIDQLPQQAKDFISGTFPTLDKTLLAKAILGGEKGAVQLSKELSGMEVQAAGKAQGLGVDTATGLDIAARGFGYQEALTGFGTVAQSLPTYEKLQEISTGQDVKTAQAQAELQGMVFNKSIVDSMRAQQLAEQEIGRFSAKSGNIGSKAFASQARGAGLI